MRLSPLHALVLSGLNTMVVGWGDANNQQKSLHWQGPTAFCQEPNGNLWVMHLQLLYYGLGKCLPEEYK